MKYTYYGHSCFSLEIKGKKLLFDPFITPNDLAKGIAADQVEADYILVSHGHADHIADCVSIAQRTGALVICSWEIYQWLQSQGVENIHPMNTGGKKSFDLFTVKCVVAQHSSSLPDGSYAGNPMGFVIMADKNIYYSGDTALTLDMQLVPQGAPISYSILPIGDNFTMGFEDAAKAAHLMQCGTVIGVHYNTFPYIEIDTVKAKDHFSKNGLTLLLPHIGETIQL
ncbi:MAG TPA: metal-dependent hydrolase [Lacibacter sp.]|nr:metal-dependent hydrolase [Lacibacter sp.]HMO87639.1 metal-dependent hydrolase [Lacibacter sp.]HMP86968.1 metal-dependent hydrolase [Lacibacter sp.]